MSATPRTEIDEDILRAAEILEREAECLRSAQTLRDHWIVVDDVDVGAEAAHDEMRRIARRLRRFVGSL